MTFDFNAYRTASGWDALPPIYLQSALEETIEEEGFPGFVLPAFVDAAVRWYAVAPKQREKYFGSKKNHLGTSD